MPLSEEFLQTVKDTNEITSVMSTYVNLKRAGRDSVCLCPFHSEKTPSCHIYTDTQSFYCFGCGAGGDVINFIRLIEHLDYVESVKFLAQRAGIPMPEDSRDQVADQKQRLLEINREAARFYRDVLISDAGICWARATAKGSFWRRHCFPKVKKAIIPMTNSDIGLCSP